MAKALQSQFDAGATAGQPGDIRNVEEPQTELRRAVKAYARGHFGSRCHTTTNAAGGLLSLFETAAAKR